MKGHLLNLLTAVSLLVAAGAVSLWGLGAWRPITVPLRDTGREARWLAIAKGRVIYFRLGSSDPSAVRGIAPLLSTGVAAEPWRYGGFDARGSPLRVWDGKGNATVTGSWEAVAVPLWFVAALAAPLPLWRLGRRRGRPPGLCRRCGYDLRATPGRCPECGTIAAPLPAR